MAETVTIVDAEARLEQLVERAAAGEDILIEGADQKLVRLVSVASPALVRPREPRKSGQLKHLTFPEAFFGKLPPEKLESGE